MLTAGHRRPADQGFTLIELLVTITLTAVIGAVVLTSLVQVLQSNQRAQARIDAFSAIQIATEGMTRELRAAHPVWLEPPATTLSPSDVEVQIRRSGECVRFRYVLEGTDLVREQRTSLSCTSPSYGTATRRVLLRDVARFQVQYTDALGAAVTVPAAVQRMAVTISRALPNQGPVEVTIAVDVRNN